MSMTLVHGDTKQVYSLPGSLRQVWFIRLCFNSPVPYGKADVVKTGAGDLSEVFLRLPKV
jgi:hypothetical protein